MTLKGDSLNKSGRWKAASIIGARKLPVEIPKRRQLKHVSFEETTKTESTDSLCSQSESASNSNNTHGNTSNNYNKSLRHFQKLESLQEETADHRTMQLKSSNLQRSNRSLHVEAMTMQKDMREMKIKMKAMEESLQRGTQKEEQLVSAIQALNRVTTKQGEKLIAYKNKKKELKLRIAERDVKIRHLKEERDVLKSACRAKEEDYLSMYNEITSLQQDLLRTLEHAGTLYSENCDLTARLKKLESRARTRKKKPSYSAQSMESMSRSFDSSKKATEELQAKIERKLFNEMELQCRAMLDAGRQEPERDHKL